MRANHFCSAVISVQRFFAIKWWTKGSSIYGTTPVQMFNGDLKTGSGGWRTVCNKRQFLAQQILGLLPKSLVDPSEFWIREEQCFSKHQINLNFYITCLCTHLYLLTLTLWYFIENRSHWWGYLVICAGKYTLLITAITVNNWQLRTSRGHRRLYQSFLLIKRGTYVSFGTWDQYMYTHNSHYYKHILLFSTAAHKPANNQWQSKSESKVNFLWMKLKKKKYICMHGTLYVLFLVYL